MNHDDDYKRQADEALRMAERAVGEDNRPAWLRVAQGWLSLIKRPSRRRNRRSTMKRASAAPTRVRMSPIDAAYLILMSGAAGTVSDAGTSLQRACSSAALLGERRSFSRATLASFKSVAACRVPCKVFPRNHLAPNRLVAIITRYRRLSSKLNLDVGRCATGAAAILAMQSSASLRRSCRAGVTG